MSEMIYGDHPNFEEIIKVLQELEKEINKWGNCIIKFLKPNKKGYEILAHTLFALKES